MNLFRVLQRAELALIYNNNILVRARAHAHAHTQTCVLYLGVHTHIEETNNAGLSVGHNEAGRIARLSLSFR